MAKETATKGVYITDKQWKFLKQIRDSLFVVVESYTSDAATQVEAFIGALVVTALVYGVSKEVLLDAVDKVYEYTKNNKPIDN